MAAAKGLAHNGAGVLVFSCELSRQAIGARLLAHDCRRSARIRTPGYGSHTTAELADRAMRIKALVGRCQLDILVVAQLNRGAYGSSGGPDVSHMAGTSELERYASAVWLIERPRHPDGSPASGARDVLEVHHGKFRHGQMDGSDLSRTVIHLDRGHCFLEADEARLAFCGADLYPGVAVP